MTKTIPECAKRSYPSRRAAKQARGRHRGGVGHDGLRPYFCDQHDAWHLGHLPRMIVGGWRARSDLFRKRAS